MTFEEWLNRHPEGSRRQAFEAGVQVGLGEKDETRVALDHLFKFLAWTFTTPAGPAIVSMAGMLVAAVKEKPPSQSIGSSLLVPKE